MLTRRAIVAGLATYPLTSAQAATGYPDRAITLIVPLNAGGASDLTARVFSERASETLGQPIIIQNRPGGGGLVGTVQVKDAKPDGYTLLLTLCGTHTTLPEMTNVPFDPVTGLQPITNLASLLSALIVPASSPAKSLAELLTWAKQKPGGLSFGSQAIGSPQHLMGVILSKLANAPMTHIPYTGGGTLALDLSAGRIDFGFPSTLNMGGFLQEGKVRAIATASKARLPDLPDVPTFAEEGYGSAVVETWFALMAPPGTPRPIVDALNAAFRKAGDNVVVQKRLLDMGFRATTGTPEDLTQLIIADRARLAPLIREFNVKAE